MKPYREYIFLWWWLSAILEAVALFFWSIKIIDLNLAELAKNWQSVALLLVAIIYVVFSLNLIIFGIYRLPKRIF